ncbi:ABC transporter permease [Calothrix sp. 336/3]|uniref:ABC transporter permease n=1 Tax=Calothrix sp. 336/3 TaxID=1337936 RepID=UPI0004E45C25|nr:ABC transporter permease [Calothrix sp. 336/3]AKG23859.1 ABC transporter permease [Calothrix sp. 336/3]
MNIDIFTNILSDTIRAATPLIFAATGELVAEKSGVLNLGVEGMMLMGAASGFMVTVNTGSVYYGLIAAVIVGGAIALIHAVLTITFNANQIAAGLALGIFASGLSAFLGADYVGKPVTPLQALNIPFLHEIPVVGKAIFQQDILVYLAVFLVFYLHWFLGNTRTGLVLRSVGESPQVSHALGLPVGKVRYLAVIWGGAMAGLAGADFSLAYTPLWAEGMTAGSGWIAIALVVFSGWRSPKILLGAYLFGAVSKIQLLLQGLGVNISPYLLSALPYLTTIVALVLISRHSDRQHTIAPLSLGKPYLANH